MSSIICSGPPVDTNFDSMAEDLTASAVELFAEYELVVQRSGTGCPQSSSSATSSLAQIGYAGDRVKGALAMLAKHAAIRAWIEALGLPCDTDPGDVIGEFSNMLLGRLKAKLLLRGFPILLATPTTATGNGLRLSQPPAQSIWLTFAGQGWLVGVRLDASFERTFTLQSGSARAQAAAAGTGILF